MREGAVWKSEKQGTSRAPHMTQLPGIIVHEWIARSGGSERVLTEIGAALPTADVYCIWDETLGTVTPNHKVHESFLARTPFRGKKALSIPVQLGMWRHIQLPPSQWMVISSHLFAHHAARPRLSPDCKKFVYVHTPARYIWEPDLDSRGRLAKPFLPILKRLDRRRAREIDSVAANSQFIAERVKRCWNREATVIYPPIDFEYIQTQIRSAPDSASAVVMESIERLPQDFVLGASRLVRYKALDKVIMYASAVGLPVVIAGDGPDLTRLQELANSAQVPVHFVGRVSDAILYGLYRRASAYVFPAIEDFGIMPVEAMATGARVVVNAVGGAAESVIDGDSGVHCKFETPEDCLEAMRRLENIDPARAIDRAIRFDKNRFRREVASWVLGSKDFEPVAIEPPDKRGAR